MIVSIRQLIAILDPASRVHFLLLLIPMLLMMALEVVSIGLILPVIQVILLGQSDGALTRIVLSLVPAGAGDNPAMSVAGVFAGFFIVKNVLLLVLIYIINWVTLRKKAAYNKKLFAHYLARPLIFHLQRNSAHLLRNITSGIGSAFTCIRLALMMSLDALLMVGAFALLVAAEPMATLGAAAVLILVGLAFYFIGSPVFRHWGNQSLFLEGALLKWVMQSFDGIRDVKLTGADEYLGRKVGDVTLSHADYACRATTASQFPRLLIESVVVVGALGVIIFLVSGERPSDDVIGIVGLYGMAAMRLMPSLNRILTAATELRFRAKFISTIYDDLVLENGSDAVEDASGGGAGQGTLSFEREITVSDVRYSYPDSPAEALNGVTLNIPKGQFFGIVGASGAGKSTLMDILLGLLKPESGFLRVDGVDTTGNLGAWQNHIGIVPQQIFLMDDTIRRNIAFGMEDDAIDDGRIDSVVKLAKLDAFVNGLPGGLDTVIGEHGTRVSGGQRQRIAIARALYRDPDVLIFDEATSALDNETEREITNAIDDLAGGKTIIIIAHRLSTVKKCDKIAFMKEGRVVDSGRFDVLLKHNAEFANLARLGDLRTDD